MSDWVVICSKRKNKKEANNKKEIYDNKKILTISEINNKILFLTNYNPTAILLYGSTAKKRNNENSDVDIMVIWKKYIPSNIKEIKNELEQKLNKKVDLVVMLYRGKLILEDINEYTTDNITLFLNNVITEAVPIIGSVHDVKLSEYIGKV